MAKFRIVTIPVENLDEYALVVRELMDSKNNTEVDETLDEYALVALVVGELMDNKNNTEVDETLLAWREHEREEFRQYCKYCEYLQTKSFEELEQMIEKGHLRIFRFPEGEWIAEKEVYFSKAVRDYYGKFMALLGNNSEFRLTPTFLLPEKKMNKLSPIKSY